LVLLLSGLLRSTNHRREGLRLRLQTARRGVLGGLYLPCGRARGPGLRGPLEEGWSASAEPIMCSYKRVSCSFEVFGVQGRTEEFIHKVREMFFYFILPIMLSFSHTLNSAEKGRILSGTKVMSPGRCIG
jgi:hypothetical protein